MGFMDKVKAQATVLAEKAQEGAKAGQAKLSDMQAKKHADALLLELGGIVYSQQAGRAVGDADAKVAELIGQLRQLESEHGPVAVTSATLMAPAAPDGTFVPTSTAASDTPEQTSTPTPTTVRRRRRDSPVERWHPDRHLLLRHRGGVLVTHSSGEARAGAARRRSVGRRAGSHRVQDR